ncbi:MAG TPA: endonuclease/exonuclease/phosphatase family protein [Thermoanaerobaculia bacterium]|nr:endonuclease/exonuclease/phosphatase family protein [Thermoanaerobaculia bacterium]
MSDAAPTIEIPPKRRWVLGILSIFVLMLLYRFFAVYTVRSGECRPKPVDPSLRVTARQEQGAAVSFPERVGFPEQQRPLVVMTYNVQGHAALLRTDHIARIAETIRSIRPDVVGINEAHRGTWQARFRDHTRELAERTGMNVAFGRSYELWGGEFGNAVLTRGRIVRADVHELPAVGEPRSVLETEIDLDGARLNVYVTHLAAWRGWQRKPRTEQLECLSRHVRTSRYPYILLGDLNATPSDPEIVAFGRMNAAQLCGADLAPTHRVMNARIDYIYADYGWEVRSTRVIDAGPSDHYPVVAELLWQKNNH